MMKGYHLLIGSVIIASCFSKSHGEILTNQEGGCECKLLEFTHIYRHYGGWEDVVPPDIRKIQVSMKWDPNRGYGFLPLVSTIYDGQARHIPSGEFRGIRYWPNVKPKVDLSGESGIPLNMFESLSFKMYEGPNDRGVSLKVPIHELFSASDPDDVKCETYQKELGSGNMKVLVDIHPAPCKVYDTEDKKILLDFDRRRTIKMIKDAGAHNLDGIIDLSSQDMNQFRVNEGIVTPKSIVIGANDITMPLTMIPEDQNLPGYVPPPLGVHKARDIQPGIETNFDPTLLDPELEIAPAIWAGENITIPDDGVIVIPDHVKSFSLLAENIIFGKNSLITWSPYYDTSSAHPYVPNRKPQAKDKSGECWHHNPPHDKKESCNGYDGEEGDNGVAGIDGDHAPIVKITAKRIYGVPRLHLAGQNGQQGGVGGRGGDGGRGQRGKTCDFWGGGAGWGGIGGKGGNGGWGGDGGHGGDGGRVILYTIAESKIQSTQFSIFTGPGSPGAKGYPGDGGSGGLGGKTGRQGNCIRRPPQRQGPPGDDGNIGDNNNARLGELGQIREPNILMPVFDKEEWPSIFLSPRLHEVMNDVVYRGDSVTISGTNFGGLCKVHMNPESTDVVTDAIATDPTTLVFVYPGGLPGPYVYISIEKSVDGGISNSNVMSIPVGMILDYVTQLNCTTNNALRESPKDCLFRVPLIVKAFGDAFEEERTRVFFGHKSISRQYVTVKSPTELEFELHPMIEATEETKYGDKVLLSLGTGGSQTPPTETVTFYMEMFEILVLGDSVVWGQGLREEQKFSFKTTEYVKSKTDLRVVRTVLAHSGAHINRHSTRTLSSLTAEDIIKGEVSNDFPTIREQAFRDFDGNKDNVKLVLVGGCINDIGAFDVIKPWKTDEQVNEVTKRYCYVDLKVLLEDLAESYPCASLLVNDYFQILAEDAWLKMAIKDFLTAMIRDSPASLVLSALKIGGYSLAADTSKEFYQKSKHYIGKSVSNVNARTNRVFMIPSGIGESRALYSEDPHLWKPFQDDPVKHLRSAGCGGNKICENANFGHPNPKGSDRYFRSIQRLLDSFDSLTVEECGRTYVPPEPPMVNSLNILSIEIPKFPSLYVPAFRHIDMKIHGSGLWEDDEVFFLKSNSGKSCQTSYLESQSLERSSKDAIDLSDSVGEISIKFHDVDALYKLCYIQTRGPQRYYHTLTSHQVKTVIPRYLNLETSHVEYLSDEPNKVKITLPSEMSPIDKFWLISPDEDCSPSDFERSQLVGDANTIMSVPNLDQNNPRIRICALYASQTVIDNISSAIVPVSVVAPPTNELSINVINSIDFDKSSIPLYDDIKLQVNGDGLFMDDDIFFLKAESLLTCETAYFQPESTSKSSVDTLIDQQLGFVTLKFHDIGVYYLCYVQKRLNQSYYRTFMQHQIQTVLPRDLDLQATQIERTNDPVKVKVTLPSAMNPLDKYWITTSGLQCRPEDSYKAVLVGNSDSLVSVPSMGVDDTSLHICALYADQSVFDKNTISSAIISITATDVSIDSILVEGHSENSVPLFEDVSLKIFGNHLGTGDAVIFVNMNSSQSCQYFYNLEMYSSSKSNLEVDDTGKTGIANISFQNPGLYYLCYVQIRENQTLYHDLKHLEVTAFSSGPVPPELSELEVRGIYTLPEVPLYTDISVRMDIDKRWEDDEAFFLKAGSFHTCESAYFRNQIVERTDITSFKDNSQSSQEGDVTLTLKFHDIGVYYLCYVQKRLNQSYYRTFMQHQIQTVLPRDLDLQATQIERTNDPVKVKVTLPSAMNPLDKYWITTSGLQCRPEDSYKAVLVGNSDSLVSVPSMGVDDTSLHICALYADQSVFDKNTISSMEIKITELSKPRTISTSFDLSFEPVPNHKMNGYVTAEFLEIIKSWIEPYAYSSVPKIELKDVHITDQTLHDITNGNRRLREEIMSQLRVTLFVIGEFYESEGAPPPDLDYLVGRSFEESNTDNLIEGLNSISYFKGLTEVKFDPPIQQQEKKSNQTVAVVASVVPILIVLIVVAFLALYLVRKRRHRRSHQQTQDTDTNTFPITVPKKEGTDPQHPQTAPYLYGLIEQAPCDTLVKYEKE